VIALISFILQFSVGKPLAAFWFLEKIVEMVLLTAFLATHRQFFKDKLMIAALMVMVTMQSVIGLGQFIKQSSFFPSYTWLGESRLEHRAGLARGSFENMERVLPYGTTSHPNVLGAVLAIGLLALWTGVRSSSEHTRTRNTIYTGAASILPLITLYLTQSWSAWLALAGGVGAIWLHAMLLKHKHSELWGKAILAGVLTTAVVTPFLLHELAQTFPNNTSFTRRDSLNQIAFRIWQQKPIFGVGLNQFSAEIENTTPTGEVVRFIQPAHHVGLLILAEMGIAGAVFAVAFLHALYAPLSGTQRKKLWATLPCIAVIFLPMAVLDHFLWTQQIGQLALMIGGVWITTHFSLVKK